MTGGSEGIGFAYARELARRSINVVLISRNLDKLKKAASVIGKYIAVMALSEQGYSEEEVH